jgi:DNA-binding transcriptional ArsR family regulator
MLTPDRPRFRTEAERLPVGTPARTRQRHKRFSSDWRKQMKARSAGEGDVSDIRSILESSPDLDTAAELLNLAGNSTRLKLLYLLENAKEMCVCDLAEMLGVSVSAVSQHLAKLRAYQLVAPRRDAQTIYYRLTDHQFNETLRQNFFN